MVAYEQQAGLRPKHDTAPDKERRQQVLLTNSARFLTSLWCQEMQWMLLLAPTELSWQLFACCS